MQQVIVIGGGIVGVSAALTLVEGGAAVVVVDRGPIGAEASGLNAGVIGGGGWGDRPNIDVALKMGSRDRFVELADRWDTDIGLDLTGTLTLLRTEEEWAWAEAAVDADRAAGRRLELVSTDDLRQLEPAADPTLLGAILDPLGARAEPRATTEAIAAEAAAHGADVRPETTVDQLRPAAGGGWEVVTRRAGRSEVLAADSVVLAAGPWCAEVAATVGVEVPIVAVRGQMWASEPQSALLRHAIAAAESALAWDAGQPDPDGPPDLTHRAGSRLTRHLYGRQRPNGEIVFGGDRVLTDDRTIDDDGIAVNHGHVGELLPAVQALPPARTWSGLMPFSLDGRPVVGPVPARDGLYLAGGLASSGFGRGPMTGRIVADLVLGRDPGYDLTPILPGARVTVSDR